MRSSTAAPSWGDDFGACRPRLRRGRRPARRDRGQVRGRAGDADTLPGHGAAQGPSYTARSRAPSRTWARAYAAYTSAASRPCAPRRGSRASPAGTRGLPHSARHGDGHHGERHKIHRRLRERPEDRLLPRPEVQPPRRRAHSPGPARARLLYAHRLLRAQLRRRRGGARDRPSTSARAPWALARANARLNGLEGNMDFLAADVFDLLPAALIAERAKYRLRHSRPAAPSRSPGARPPARSAATRRLTTAPCASCPAGGYLATASCSHFMPQYEFERMLRSAARDANVSLREVEVRKQAPGPPHTLERARDGVPEVLHIPDNMSRAP